MAKFKVTNTSNIRKYTYGHQLEPGETKEVDLLVKEADQIPRTSFDVERLDGAEEESDDASTGFEADSTDESNDKPTEEVEAGDEASLDKNPETNDSGGEN